MRLHRFFTKHIIDKEKINSFSSHTLVHQLRRVFRLHEGDLIIFFDGSGNDYVSEIVSMTDVKLEFKVTETIAVKQKTPRKLALAVSLIKKDNFEWVIQKGTELGVAEFIPLLSERSEKKGFNMERAEKIMTEAAEQSGRSELPKISNPLELDIFLETEKRGMIAFHTDGANFSDEDISATSEVVALVGPEGGWSEKEIKMFKNKKAAIVQLNTPVLRAETAAIVASTLLLIK
jgi:16S rRNA (uracil1498-N3)-methyltransferase